MNQQRLEKISKFGFEFLSIFIGIFAAFALENWNDNRKDAHTAVKILSEISNGLKQDILDIGQNENGHKMGLAAANYFNDVLNGKKTSTDSLPLYYLLLSRDFILIQNRSGYESLKSKGLDIVEDDSLRYEIIALYENDYNAMRKIEEEYDEMQFYRSYFKDFNTIFVPNFVMNERGTPIGFHYPLKISEQDRKMMQINLWKMRSSRLFAIASYADMKTKIEKLQKNLEKELKK